MDEWHRKLALDLGVEPPNTTDLDGATVLEIAFGRARSAVAYALELALAHRLPATGNVAGDDVWLRLGEARARFTLNRREGHVLVSRPGLEPVRVRWDATNRAIVQDPGDGPSVAVANLDAMAQASIDLLVASWRAHPSAVNKLSAPPPNFEDEPTKG
jgi:hypothetical protein